MDYSKLGDYFQTLNGSVKHGFIELDDFMKKSLDWSVEVKCLINTVISEAKAARKKNTSYICTYKLPNLPETPREVETRYRAAIKTSKQRKPPNSLLVAPNDLETTQILPRSSRRTKNILKLNVLDSDKTITPSKVDKSKINEVQDSFHVQHNEKFIADEQLDGTYVLSASRNSQQVMDIRFKNENKSWDASTPILRRSNRTNLHNDSPDVQINLEKSTIVRNDKQRPSPNCGKTNTINVKEVTSGVSPIEAKLSSIENKKKSSLGNKVKISSELMEEEKIKVVPAVRESLNGTLTNKTESNVLNSALKYVSSPSKKQIIYSSTSDSENAKSDSERMKPPRENKRTKPLKYVTSKKNIISSESELETSKSDIDVSSRPSKRKQSVTPTSDCEKESDRSSAGIMAPPKSKRIKPVKKPELSDVEVSSGSENNTRSTRTKPVRKPELSDVEVSSGSESNTRSTRTKPVRKPELSDVEVSSGSENNTRSTRTKTLKRKVSTKVELTENLEGSTRTTLTKSVMTQETSNEVYEVLNSSQSSDTTKRSTRTKTIVSQATSAELPIVADAPTRSTRTKPVIKRKISKEAEIIDSSSNADSVKRSTRTKTITTERSVDGENAVSEKKKSKVKKKDVKEENEEVDNTDTVRVTRTKSKAAKQELGVNLPRKSGLTVQAKKSLSKAKIISLKKQGIDKMQPVVSITPHKNSQASNPSTSSKLMSSSKYSALLNSTNKMKTPLNAMPMKMKFLYPMSGSKINVENCLSSNKKENIRLPLSTDKEALKRMNKVGIPLERLANSVTKLNKDELLEKLKSKKEKEEEAVIKKQLAIKNKQEELKRRNEMKLKQALKQREKLEMEKYNNIVQLEKEKEEKHKSLLKERDLKIKEDLMKKKLIKEQKIAETEERRRQEEEARMAKIKEQEAEQQRLMLERKKELERQEKRAQERLAEKKAREMYEMKLKQEQMKQEKILAAKKAAELQSANKKAKRVYEERKEWKARNENDYGLEDENSGCSSDDEDPDIRAKPIPLWAQKIKKAKILKNEFIPLHAFNAYMPCYQKTPDIHRMFKMTPSKRIKRSSSAIWNTPHC